MGIKISIVGATGAVGRIFLQYLEKSDIAVDEITVYASQKSEGKVVHFRGKSLRITPLTSSSVNLKQCDFAFFSAGAPVSKEYIPLFRDKGAVCIDNSSHFRMHEDVPIIIPEVNKNKLNTHKGIISNSNCNVAGIAVALAPLHRNFGVKRVIVSTYQSVSGAGQRGVDELEDRVRSHVFKDNLTKPQLFEKDILFNVLPKIPHQKPFLPGGYTEEEDKVPNEIAKILGDSSIKSSATCVRVPVFVSHSAAVNFELRKNASLEDVCKAIEAGEGLVLARDSYTTPKEAEGKDPVYVSRVRVDESNPNTFWMWVVSDNLRKGAAYNAFQILQLLIK
ncbi:MAG: aspartate-semialdehyde dehydrogenase [Planctomycetes bacterium]|nr:aspartate-semialdehyde dehydrogenase [Planctomycetota bacterium]